MGAFDGLFTTSRYVPGRDMGRVYVSGQPSFSFTRTFTIDDLVALINEARADGRGHVYVESDTPGLSGARLDLWYAESLVRHLCNSQLED